MVSSLPCQAATSSTSTFTDADVYRQSLRGAQAEIVLVGRGHFHGELTKVDFPRLWLQRGHDTLARSAWVTNTPSRIRVYFPSRKNRASTSHCGTEVRPGDLVMADPGATFHVRTSGETRWGSLWLTPDDLAAGSVALVGSEFTSASLTHLRADGPCLSRLRHLHASAIQLARIAPEILTYPEASRALEQQLMHATVRCLAAATPVETMTSQRRHSAIMRRLEGLLAENGVRPLHVTDICTTIGVSERTLRLCCQEQLGMGPIQYLWLRRMNLARRALLSESQATTTVTVVATGHGFWELGRFAVTYRTLFGESPSMTLARPPVEPPKRMHPFDF